MINCSIAFIALRFIASEIRCIYILFMYSKDEIYKPVTSNVNHCVVCKIINELNVHFWLSSGTVLLLLHNLFKD